MAPKKAKKGKKYDIEDDDADDLKLGDIPEPAAVAAKQKLSVPKKKKGKKKPVAGDWSDDDAAEAPSHVAEEIEEAPQAPKAPATASTFALLQVRRRLKVWKVFVL